MALTKRVLAFTKANPEVVLAIVGAAVARFVFWQMTHRMFEDGLTTITAARNAVEGIGLTHHPGEGHVQSYTSAISVLVPLVGEGIQAGGGGFAAIRLASILAAGIAIFAAYLLGRELRVSRWAMLFPYAYLAFDQNQIFYGMAGMETEMAVAILLLSVYFVMRERLAWSGVFFGLCILARPDFILWVVPASIYLVWKHRRTLRALIATFGLAAAVAGPWFIFTTVYYGAPLPETIGAKVDRYFHPPALTAGPGTWISYLSDQLQQRGDALWHMFTPFLENGFVVHTPISQWLLGDIAFAVIVLAITGAWYLRRVPMVYPVIAYLLIFLVYRIIALPPEYYEWYLAPFTATVVLMAAAGLSALGLRVGRKVALAVSAVLAVAFAMHMPFSFPLEARVQHNVENQVRKQMGLWLQANVPRGQGVASESAGYMGWFGRVKLYDYPGLTSPTAYHVLQRLGPAHNTFQEMVNALRPDWLVMRPWELQALRSFFPAAANQYRVVREFSAAPGSVNLDQWGLIYVNIDTDFFVLRRAAG
jgi:hypothetical protein